MSLTYTWKVTGIKIRDEEEFPNTVFQSYWRKIGTDENGVSGKFDGATPFILDATQESFIPFENLTEEIVLGWIQEVVVGEYEEHVNEQIQTDYMNKINPITDLTKTSDLPWNK